MMVLHLLRHGRTEANEKRFYCGKGDLPLSPEGAEEILRLRKIGLYPAAEVFFTSGMRRTDETLRLIYGDVSVIKLELLREYDFGEFEGKTHGELEALPDYIAWIEDKTSDTPCPGGESRNQFERRVCQAFETLMQQMAETNVSSCAVVCHGGVIATAMNRFFPGRENFYGWQPAPGRGYTLHYQNEQFLNYNLIEENQK